jgi:hypothetical protein
MPADGPTLVLPCPADGSTDLRLRERAGKMMHRHAWNVREELVRLQEDQLVESVHIEIRRVPIVPSEKIYLLGEDREKAEVLYATYAIQPRSLMLDGENLQIRDIFGLGAELERFVADDGADGLGTRFVKMQQSRFDGLWAWAVPDESFNVTI